MQNASVFLDLFQFRVLYPEVIKRNSKGYFQIDSIRIEAGDIFIVV